MIGMNLKSASYINRFRISWKDIFRYQIYHKTDIRNHYVIWSAMFNCSHGDIYVYLELCSVINRWDFSFVHHFWLAMLFFLFKMPSRQQKRRAKQREEYLQSRDHELEFSRVPYSDSTQKRASARDGN